MKRLPVKFVLSAVTFAIFLPAGQFAVADLQEYEPSDVPPKIRNILFSEKSVGFISRRLGERKEEYFILGRKARSLQTVSNDLFFRTFKYRDDIKPRTEQSRSVILKASNGRKYISKYANCSEGRHDAHELWEEERLLEDYVKPCHSISSVEIVGDQLWLGTRIEGRAISWPAEGIIILSLKDGKLAGKINEENGLSGNLVEVIRIDPYSEKIWIATRTGLTVINQNGEIGNKSYFYEDFEPETGIPIFFLTPEFKESNLLATISRKLGIENTMAYYKATQKIPDEVLSEVSPYSYHMGMWATSSGFLPQEMNVLVPFFIDAAWSRKENIKRHAKIRICAFNDKMVVEYLQTANRNDIQDVWTRQCMDKYYKLGLLGEDYNLKREVMLLDKVKKALADIRTGSPSVMKNNRRAPYIISVRGYVYTVLSSTKSLKKMGNLHGFELIKEFFSAFDPEEENNQNYFHGGNELLSTILREFSSYREIELIMREAINKGFLRACEYFENQHEIMHGKYLDAKNAEVMIVSMDKFHNRPNKTISLPPGLRISEREINNTNFNDPCSNAFNSQMKDADVKRGFLKIYYHKLTKRQKELVDRLMSGTYKDPEAEEINKQLREQMRKQPGVREMGIPVFRQRGP